MVAPLEMRCAKREDFPNSQDNPQAAIDCCRTRPGSLHRPPPLSKGELFHSFGGEGDQICRVFR